MGGLRITYRDLQTGSLAEERREDLTVWDLTEGNWSCDCNRADAFGLMDTSRKFCDGCKRFVVDEVSGDLEGWTQDELIREANREYQQ